MITLLRGACTVCALMLGCWPFHRARSSKDRGYGGGLGGCCLALLKTKLSGGGGSRGRLRGRRVGRGRRHLARAQEGATEPLTAIHAHVAGLFRIRQALWLVLLQAQLALWLTVLLGRQQKVVLGASRPHDGCRGRTTVGPSTSGPGPRSGLGTCRGQRPLVDKVSALARCSGRCTARVMVMVVVMVVDLMPLAQFRGTQSGFGRPLEP